MTKTGAAFELTEFHDARLREVQFEFSSARLLFSHFVCFSKTASADVFDVSSAQLEILGSNCSQVDVTTNLGDNLLVRDGHVSLNGSKFAIRRDVTLDGRCECELKLTDGGKIIIRGERIEIRFGASKVFEQWRGPLE